MKFQRGGGYMSGNWFLYCTLGLFGCSCPSDRRTFITQSARTRTLLVTERSPPLNGAS
jgi:hypothetical protein